VSTVSEDVLSHLAKTIGVQDIQVGRRSFEHAFVIKANAPRAVTLLMKQVRSCIRAMPEQT